MKNILELLRIGGVKVAILLRRGAPFPASKRKIVVGSWSGSGVAEHVLRNSIEIGETKIGISRGRHAYSFV